MDMSNVHRLVHSSVLAPIRSGRSLALSPGNVDDDDVQSMRVREKKTKQLEQTIKSTTTDYVIPYLGLYVCLIYDH